MVSAVAGPEAAQGSRQEPSRSGRDNSGGLKDQSPGRRLHIKGFFVDGLAHASGNLGKMTLAEAIEDLCDMACLLHGQDSVDVKDLGILHRTLFPPFTNDCHHIVCSEDRPSRNEYRRVWSVLFALESSRSLKLRQLKDPKFNFSRHGTWPNLRLRKLLYRLACWLTPRQLILTWNERVGVIIADSVHTGDDGDEVWILFGCPTPMVLRPTAEQGMYKVIYPAYIPGLMDGEVFGGSKRPGRNWQGPPIGEIVLC
jgi:hypothetical protein